MIATNVCHALGLHMHQPPGNLALLIETNPWEAEQIIRCYERAVRYARQYADVAHLHIGFSGILLEQLRDPSIIDRYRHVIDIPAMLDAYRETPNIELIGMGHFHPIFPLIPKADWDDQLRMGREIMEDTFGRAPRGFWPPEMAFSMEMIPALVRAGYDYVVVDGVHVHPEDGVSDVFRPYLACFDGVCIGVVPRDREVSNAQESGLDAAWFAHEVTHRCRFSPRPDEPRLVTTWSDGENGGWFRQTHEGSGFFGHYFSPYMEHVRGGEYPVRPVGLSDYLAEHPPAAHAQVQTGAWNVGSTSGFDFSQWAGSAGQRRAGEALVALSRRWWSLNARAAKLPGSARDELDQVRRQVLEGETSCYLFWGDDWLPQLDAIMEAAEGRLDALESLPTRSTQAAGLGEPQVPDDQPPQVAVKDTPQPQADSTAPAASESPPGRLGTGSESSEKAPSRSGAGASQGASKRAPSVAEAPTSVSVSGGSKTRQSFPSTQGRVPSAPASGDDVAKGADPVQTSAAAAKTRPTSPEPTKAVVKKTARKGTDRAVEAASASKAPSQGQGAGTRPTAVTKKTIARSRSPKKPRDGS